MTLTETQANGCIEFRGEFNDLADAHIALGEYLRAYHPWGYGTVGDINRASNTLYGNWIVTGSRSASCE